MLSFSKPVLVKRFELLELVNTELPCLPFFFSSFLENSGPARRTSFSQRKRSFGQASQKGRQSYINGERANLCHLVPAILEYIYIYTSRESKIPKPFVASAMQWPLSITVEIEYFDTCIWLCVCLSWTCVINARFVHFNEHTIVLS